MTFLEVGGQAVKLREKLKVKHRRRIESANYTLMASPLGQALAEQGRDLVDLPAEEAGKLTARHAADIPLMDGMKDAVILAYIESVDGVEPTGEWLGDLDEDDYKALEDACGELERARQAAMPVENPDGVDDPASPTTA